MQRSKLKIRLIAIVGAVGVPANYGGFESLVENLVRYHSGHALTEKLTVYCSAKSYPERELSYLSAQLRYVYLNANGAQSTPYDLFSLFSAVWNRSDVIVLLGVSGAVALPFVRLLSSVRIVTNIDGVEWRREKWKGLAKCFLRWSERLAVRYSHEVIADNPAIATYVKDEYGRDCHVIAYGGDHALDIAASEVSEYFFPENYAFSVCRVEPENNVHLILQAFSYLSDYFLVMVGNWKNSEYGRDLQKKYALSDNLKLLDPIYDLGKLKSLRANMAMYVHGHSAGGTNPSLVEAMHFGKPIFAFDCDFNRATTENSALFFKDVDSLVALIQSCDVQLLERTGQDMKDIADKRYRWDVVARQYFTLIGNTAV